MVHIKPFAVEQWMDEYENTPGVINIAETCSASISIDELTQLADDKSLGSPIASSKRLVYGAIKGSDTLRNRVVDIYNQDGQSKLTSENVLITQGAIGANFLSLYTLVQPGDHVICVYPTYQQLYSVPESIGAEVSLWKLKREDGFVPNVDDLKSLVKDNTKMIIINNPNNPTGALIPDSALSQIVSLARSRNITILSDEVYRPLFHSLPDTGAPSPITSFGYDNVLVTGSMSKAYALAGIRLGWIVSPSAAILANLAAARDYNTISVSGLDDSVAAYALAPSVVDPLLKRNISIARTNLALLDEFVKKHEGVCKWVKPMAGTTAFVQFLAKKDGAPVDDVKFCLDVLEKTKVFFVPGSRCFGGGEDFKGYVRIGYVGPTDELKEGLEKLGEYVEANLA